MKKIISLLAASLIAVPSFSYAENINTIFTRLEDFVQHFSQNTPMLKETPPPITDRVILGNERITTDHSYLIDGKRVGLVTNQTGINANMIKTVDILAQYPKATLTSLYSPEHGLDGTARAGAYVDSYTDPRLDLPVYSLYGKTREPSKSMLDNVDVLLFDMQDIGSRTYTYISTLNYVMRAGAKYSKPVIVLDRPNPLGGIIVDGYIAQDKYLTFVGVDNLPIQHGMTVGELAKFFNRKIHCDLTVVPMKNYTRSMIWQDTGLTFVPTSPNIPNIVSAFGYIPTGMGEGTSVGQGDKFTWVGAKGLDSEKFAAALNAYGLPGVSFSPENKSSRGGVRMAITNYRVFNPTQTAIYILTTANIQKKLTVPTEINGKIPMFEKIWGGTKFGTALKNGLSPEKVIESYQDELNQFKRSRLQYLIYQ
ncbi:MAG: DUF1343 domain-containing protein [Peptostreptococcaceae bacterium]|nr:DUF1343 domain-containing protein [Peptostreptococcaceae bacterium]